ncbi:MAG: SDR family NAD(P)-dependent oxidoreductase [Firmicutes bacterium]|nr:SDR family NAD(P)-dependent oxidoreductase [Bacillota bacterium]
MQKKVCVITGATGGIGSAACDQMAEKYIVVVSDINPSKIEAKVAELRAKGFDAEGKICDTSDREQCFELARFAASLGPVQGVIQLAGLTPGFCKYTDLIDVDVMGTININEAFFSVMEAGSCIIDICSCVAHFMPEETWPMDIFEIALTDRQKFRDEFVDYIGMYGDDEACSSIAYVYGRTFIKWFAGKSAYALGRKKGIRIMTVSIGFVVTEQSMADLAATGSDADARLAQQMSYSAFGRAGTTKEVAFLFDTIIDERNSWLSGTDIYFDNGCSANGYLGQFEPYDPSVNPYDPERD